MPAGIFHREFDMMIEAIETDHHKKSIKNCGQAELIFEVLDDKRTRVDETTGKNTGVSGIFNLAQVVGAEPGLPATISVFCTEFSKNRYGTFGHPTHNGMFVAIPSDLECSTAEVLQARVEGWSQTHHHFIEGKPVMKVLILFDDQTNPKVITETEAICNSLDMFFATIPSSIDPKELRLVIGHKVKEILQKLSLQGVPFTPAK